MGMPRQNQMDPALGQVGLPQAPILRMMTEQNLISLLLLKLS